MSRIIISSLSSHSLLFVGFYSCFKLFSNSIVMLLIYSSFITLILNLLLTLESSYKHYMVLIRSSLKSPYFLITFRYHQQNYQTILSSIFIKIIDDIYNVLKCDL
ncbi:hypothetical protein NH340_JMT01049 [Sarcoptes scabiei]|nr:hypothetical protein NH340_JMT01049 [Sarcoptes scabiei]